MSDGALNKLSEFSFFTPVSLRKKLLWFIQLRWFAIVGVVIYEQALAYFFSSTTQRLPLLVCAGLLLFFNAILTVYTRRKAPVSIAREEKLLFIQIFVDMGLLTAIIHFSGGVENPLYFFFIFYIIITSIVTDRPMLPFLVAGLDCILFTLMALGEHFGWIRHFHITLISHELSIIFFALIIFYITIFVSAYISISLIARHRKVKNLILEQNRKLESSAEEKMQFFRFVSHELKSPIVAIESTANVLTDIMSDQMDSKVRSLIQRIQTRTRQILSMIKDLLDISYDQSLEVKEERVDPCDYIARFIESEQSSWEFKQIELSLHHRCRGPSKLLLDKFKLEKILTNILGNAVRYTPPGGKISITTEILDANWVLTVADSGIGISPEDLNHIFDEFFRGKNAKKHIDIGTGLGMNIVKKFVEEMHGTINVESELNKGTTVIIKVPVDE